MTHARENPESPEPEPAMCYQGNGIWPNHDTDLRGFCRRCRKDLRRKKEAKA